MLHNPPHFYLTVSESENGKSALLFIIEQKRGVTSRHEFTPWPFVLDRECQLRSTRRIHLFYSICIYIVIYLRLKWFLCHTFPQKPCVEWLEQPVIDNINADSVRYILPRLRFVYMKLGPVTDFIQFWISLWVADIQSAFSLSLLDQWLVLKRFEIFCSNIAPLFWSPGTPDAFSPVCLLLSNTGDAQEQIHRSSN